MTGHTDDQRQQFNCVRVVSVSSQSLRHTKRYMIIITLMYYFIKEIFCQNKCIIYMRVYVNAVAATAFRS